MMIILTVIIQFQLFLVHMLVSEYAIERWFKFLPLLFSVLTLPCETLRP